MPSPARACSKNLGMNAAKNQLTATYTDVNLDPTHYQKMESTRICDYSLFTQELIPTGRFCMHHPIRRLSISLKKEKRDDHR